MITRELNLPWMIRPVAGSLKTRPSAVIALAIFILFVLFALGLPRWEYLGDPPLLNYAGWLMVEQGAMPYRDFFETSMPGTFMVHAAIVALGLTENTVFIALGVSLLFTLGLIGASVLHIIGHRVGLAFALSYVTIMLILGPGALMQRELIGTFIVAVAVLLALRHPHMSVVGMLFGMAALLKPQLALIAPIVVIAAILLHRQNPIKGIAFSLVGFALPLVMTGIWLWSNDALTPFLFLLNEYLPLHIQQTTYHVFLEPVDRFKYTLRQSILFGGFWVLVAAPVLLAVLQFTQAHKLMRSQHIVFAALILITGIYGVMPALAGQFWNYHYFPFIFFAVLCASSLLIFRRSDFPRWVRNLALAGALGIPVIQGGMHFDAKMVQKVERDAKIVADMAYSIRKWCPTGCTIQPIDWTKGAISAMLQTESPLATRFLYDYHFRHHVSRPEIQLIRADFMASLIESAPEMILEVPTRPRAKGFDVSYDWPELDRFISENYAIVETQDNHIIHIKKGVNISHLDMPDAETLSH